jgi:hypothetical protein
MKFKMAKITRFPDYDEEETAAAKAVEYLNEIGIFSDTGESDVLEGLIYDTISSYFKGQEEDPNTMKPGWILATNLLVINSQRYYLTDEEMQTVKKRQEQYPDNQALWEERVLSDMRTNSLKPRLG